MTIQCFEIENELLKNHIECIYVIENEPGAAQNSFLILPSTDGYLSFTANTKTTVNTNEFITEYCPGNLFESSIQIGLSNPCVNRYIGNVREICIRFKSLGIFHFFNEKLVLESVKHNLNFIPEDDYVPAMLKILQQEDSRLIANETECYLLSKCKNFTHPFLEEIIIEIKNTDIDSKLNFEAFSRKANITRQTLNNHFKKYVNLSPVEYRQIYRFRKFIDLKLGSKRDKKSMNVLYDVGFFDQSHLIKFFKKCALQSPVSFFSEVHDADNHKTLLLWQ
jgi:AraC-like DNA-binding protein